MRRQDVVNNVKSLVKSVRNSREFFRTAWGASTRSVFGSDKPLPLGVATPFDIRPYRDGQTVLPVQLVTPPDGHYMHTFFDVDPISPSGRYLVLTKVPFIWRVPYVGDMAQICVVDLQEGTCKAVYTTSGWGTQLGANAQWGVNDDTVYCNDVIKGRGTGVAIDLRTLESRVLDGPVYGVSPDRRYSYSGSIDLVNAGQTGYGVPEHLLKKVQQSTPLSTSEGIWKTDLASGKSELLISVADLVAQLPEQEHLKGGVYYIYNIKVNPQNTRMLVVIFTRNAPGRLGWPMQLVTCDLDGKNAKLAVPDSLWRKGGHHANWHPDGERIVMNLRPDKKNMGFYMFNQDGSDLQLIAPGHVGGGHPSLNASARYLMTDAYVSEGFADDKGEVPIRLVEMAPNREDALCRIFTNNVTGGRRVDPHPVWSHGSRKICFNGVVAGRRQVFIADATRLL